MAFDAERIRKYIPKGNGYNSEFAKDLEEAAQFIERSKEALEQYANPINWNEDYQGIRRVWLEPGSTSPEAYNGFEAARFALLNNETADVSVGLNEGLYMNDESKHITKKIILMASWALTGGYFVIASYGGGGATCAIMSFVCGFMVARNMSSIVTPSDA